MELSQGAPASRRLFARFPWGALSLTVALAVLGVWNLASASRNGNANLWLSQLGWMGVGLLAGLLLTFWDYRNLLALAYPLYGAVILLLVGVMVHGRVVMGARRWLDLGPIHLQPSELAKLAVILILARQFHDHPSPKGGRGLPQLLVPFALILLPVALVMKQPDLGTALLVAAVGLSLCVFAGIRPVTLAGLTVVGALSLGLAWHSFLKGYQRRRVESFLNPAGDALGAGYHANQSMIAVGSGQLSGKGWGKGTQTQLSFLPEQHTDFIFSVWAEEHGFLACLGLLGLYLGLLLWTLWVAGQARERFGSYLAAGVAGMIFWHVFINIGMVTGLLPVVGVTLPLMSYGGSSLFTILLGLALSWNVQLRHHLF